MKPAGAFPTFILGALLFLTATTAAHSRQLSLMGGLSTSPDSDTGTSYAWQIQYRHRLLDHVSLGVSYLNEGHLTNHHRDGYSAAVWGHLPLLHDRVEVAAGIGPYVYFDTVPSGTGYNNDHGVKLITALSSTWYSERNWFLQLQGNYVSVGGAFDSTTVLAGVGYRFLPERSRTSEAAAAALLPANEINVMLGQTIANSLGSQQGVATEVEFRHRFMPYVDGSVAFLYEGDSRLIRRDGMIVELWAVEDLLDDRFGVGIGGGAYFDIETYSKLESERVSGILTLTSSYRFARKWRARVSWNRILTNYDRDSDIIVGGVGYLF